MTMVLPRLAPGPPWTLISVGSPSVAAAGGRHVVVANGTEGEPASAKDKVLAATEPHLVLDGAVIAASVVGAGHAFIVVDRAVTETMEIAVAERQAARLDGVRLHVLPAAGGFVAGEASAVVSWIERGVPAPRQVPPRLAERGLHGQPTLVQNIETLAHVALIARYGSGWFRAAGTADEPGSMLVTVTGAVRDRGVKEVEIGCRVRDVLALAGGHAAPISALLIGGYSARWTCSARKRARQRMVHRHQRLPHFPLALPEAPMRARARLKVDPIACDGRGLCAEVAPELVTLDDWGYPILLAGAISPEWVAHARAAVRLCPKLALKLDA